MLELDRAQVMAARLAAHHLHRRLPHSAKAPLEVTATCGVRDVHHSGLFAFHARIERSHPGDIASALDSRGLVTVASARGTITIVPSRDAAIFTLGVLPAGEQSLRTFLKPFLPVLDASGWSTQGALDRACEIAAEALADRSLDSGALSTLLTNALPELSAMCRGRCGCVHIDEGLFQLVGMAGVWCVGVHEKTRVHVRTDQWLGTTPTPSDRAAARVVLVRRYLAAFGPALPAEIAAWAAISNADARASLAAAPDETVEVRVDGRRRWVHADTVGAWESPPEPDGVRLLPPYDPFLECRDRTTLIPDRELQKRVWRSSANPGVVLANGELVGTWRVRKTGTTVRTTVEPFAKLPRPVVESIEEEAHTLAALRECTAAEVTVAP